MLLPLSGYLATDFGVHRSPDGTDKAADQTIAKGLRVYECSSVGKSLPSSRSEGRNQHDPRRCAATISNPQSAVPWQELAQPNATFPGTTQWFHHGLWSSLGEFLISPRGLPKRFSESE